MKNRTAPADQAPRSKAAQIPDQFAIGLSTRRRPAGQCQTDQQLRHRNEQLSFLQGQSGLGDRRTLFSGRRLACRRRYQLAIVTRPDRLKLQCRDDLARIPGAFRRAGRRTRTLQQIDAQLVGDNRDNEVELRLFAADGPDHAPVRVGSQSQADYATGDAP